MTLMIDEIIVSVPISERSEDPQLAGLAVK